MPTLRGGCTPDLGSGARTYTVAVADAPHDLPRSGLPLDLGPRAVLIPVKAFSRAKRRLGDTIDIHQRAELAMAMADHVVSAARSLPVAVVCDDNAVAEWARSRGVLVIWEPGRGLNGAVEAGVAYLRAEGVAHVTVSHADLPRASGLDRVGELDAISLVPDRVGNGTNVIALPSDAGFRFSYGPGSFARHRFEAERTGLPVRVLDRPDLAWDVDLPDDLASLATLYQR